jgi:hypothetical protein
MQWGVLNESITQLLQDLQTILIVHVRISFTHDLSVFLNDRPLMLNCALGEQGRGMTGQCASELGKT